MKTTLTGTLVGTLLLAGSTTAALAVAPLQETPSGNNAPTSSPAPNTQVPNQVRQYQGTNGSAMTGNRSMHRHAVRSAARTDETGDRMTEALNLLSADGYFNVQSLTPQGNQFIANATQNGRNVSVIVDPQSGKITNRS
jgi:hypothetical protein